MWINIFSNYQFPEGKRAITYLTQSKSKRNRKSLVYGSKTEPSLTCPARIALISLAADCGAVSVMQRPCSTSIQPKYVSPQHATKLEWHPILCTIESYCVAHQTPFRSAFLRCFLNSYQGGDTVRSSCKEHQCRVITIGCRHEYKPRRGFCLGGRRQPLVGGEPERSSLNIRSGHRCSEIV